MDFVFDETEASSPCQVPENYPPQPDTGAEKVILVSITYRAFDPNGLTL